MGTSKHLKAGYVVMSDLKNVTESDAKMLDVINIAFAHCRDSKFHISDDTEMRHIARIKSLNPNIKILVSIGGWGSGGFSIMSSTPETRHTFAVSCAEAVIKYGLDGIDIDWEYPCIDWAGIDASPDDKWNFTLMLQEVRDELNKINKDLLLTIAVGCDSYFINNTEMDKVAKILDYVSIMTYDMRGCGDRVTGHHTNLYPKPKEKWTNPRDYRSALHSVRIYNEAGVPKEKIVIGAAFYSRMWKNIQKTENGGYNSPADPGNYGPSYAELAEKYINKNGFTRYFDDECKAPYLSNGKDFISYDDEASIKHKCEFIKAEGLLGIMYWEHSCDSTRTLLKAINDNL